MWLSRAESTSTPNRCEDLAAQAVLEIVDDFAGEAYRLVYTVQFNGRIYALHAFQKKSKTGIKTPKSEIDLIQVRLRQAAQEHARWLEHQRGK